VEREKNHPSIQLRALQPLEERRARFQPLAELFEERFHVWMLLEPDKTRAQIRVPLDSATTCSSWPNPRPDLHSICLIHDDGANGHDEDVTNDGILVTGTHHAWTVAKLQKVLDFQCQAVLMFPHVLVVNA